VTPLPPLGQLVWSRAGRDAGRPFIVVGLCDDRHVLVSDGDLRPIRRPKRKNARHLTVGRARHPEVAAGRLPTDAELRNWLRAVVRGTAAAEEAATSTGPEEEKA
jgi:large subunit ribosomal protein L14e